MSGATAVIVGAGAGGIAAATQLARKGFQVQVLDRHESVGGRCSLLYKDGFRFDQGPSLVLMPELFRRAFEDLGTSLKNEGVSMLRCEPNYCIWFADHDSIELSRDMPRLKAEIERHEGAGGFYRFCAFMAAAGYQYEMSMQSVFNQSFPTMWSMMHLSLIKAVLALRPSTSFYQQAATFFRSEKMRRVWSFTSMYLGMSPYRAPATYCMLPYAEISDGIWYPEGGFQKVLQALGEVGTRLGVNYRLNTPVKKVQLSTDGLTATGVQLASGDVISADLVVVNADLVYACNRLLPPSSHARRLQDRSASCSSISFYWSFGEEIPELKPHNVFLADKYRESFDTIFDEQGIPEDPSFYVNVPSRVDQSAAPTGKDAVMVLVPVGHLPKTTFTDVEEEKARWESLVARMRDTVIKTIEERTGTRGLRSKLLNEQVNTPLTWRDRFNLDRGAILGLSHSFNNVGCFRPHIKHPHIRGLYFAGCSTQPGAGVPACLVSGRLVSEQIVKDWKKRDEAQFFTSWKFLMGLAMLGLLMAVMASFPRRV
ncbi:phytoene desaturase family protein [Aspergillus affinis]|uniref:phytoene desaturase family protein n=1 Tax=Aspergillus affinis TaxID=1070780 RepID=UPI0022FDD0E9|nr:phytoene dehydrogenase [Aspergillus affinis]KAI9038983.1 phytoene dehydrogenase [Aspergillus affinis]